MLRHGSSLSAVRERRIEYELSYDRPTGAGAALPTVKTPWDISSQGHKSQASAFMRRWPFPVAEN